jgi:NAD(P)-dependent dehydrogenase (short-subunit alcohol dehydrogenase family)
MKRDFVNSFFGLEGRVALVTGAGRGLGRGMALALAQAGAELALVSRTEAELEKVCQEITGIDPSRKVFPIQADLTDFQEIPGVVDKVVAHFGRIDILVNNAGRNIREAAENFSGRDWDAVMNINLKASFVMAQAVGKVMIDQGKGKIINTASLTSFIGLPNMVAYCASRGGVQQMTKALAIEWAKHGIHVNAIAPGYFLTKQTESLYQDPGKREWILSKIPMGRIGDSLKDLGGVAVFLASSASDYITGQTIVVDGGWLAG